MTVDVSGSTLGPPDNLRGVNAQNGVQYGGVGVKAGAGGTITGSTLYGSGFGDPSADGTAALLYAAKKVTLSNDLITGDGTDVGVAIVSSTGVTISHNQIGRTAPDVPDSFGIGVQADATKVSVDGLREAPSASPPSTVTLVCNTFSGWKTDIEGATQPVCITTNTLPDGTVKVPYSATLASISGTAPVSWSRVSGSLPPGLVLAANGSVSGTPTKEGAYDFTVKVTDANGESATQPLTIVVITPPPPPRTPGYMLTASDGGVFTFGTAHFRGSAANLALRAPIVGIATKPNGVGYWLAAKDGGCSATGFPSTDPWVAPTRQHRSSASPPLRTVRAIT